MFQGCWTLSQTRWTSTFLRWWFKMMEVVQAEVWRPDVGISWFCLLARDDGGGSSRSLRTGWCDLWLSRDPWEGGVWYRIPGYSWLLETLWWFEVSGPSWGVRVDGLAWLPESISTSSDFSISPVRTLVRACEVFGLRFLFSLLFIVIGV